MLSVDSISLNIGKRQILNNVSLDVKPGELLAVLGANGAGKSTLLKVIAGEINANSGSVSYSGKELKNFTSKGLAKIRGVLSQSFSLNMPYKVEEVVMMGRYPHFKEVPSFLDYEIIKAAMQQVDVLSFKDRVYTTLSGGEKQRVHIARVLAQIWNDEKTDNHTANYLLLDEPVSSLDILHQHRILQLGQELKEKGYAVLAVLHDMNLASQYADRVAILKNGNLIACGNTREVLNEVNIYKAFGMAVTVINQAGYSFPFIVPDLPLLEPLISQTNQEISYN